jgi:hypothetical protein
MSIFYRAKSISSNSPRAAWMHCGKQKSDNDKSLRGYRVKYPIKDYSKLFD